MVQLEDEEMIEGMVKFRASIAPDGENPWGHRLMVDTVTTICRFLELLVAQNTMQHYRD